METVTDLTFLGSKITTNGDCSHESKRRLLLGIKLWQSRQCIKKYFDNLGIILPTKVYIVKALVLPVVMYRYESWTMREADCWRTDAFELWCCRRLLRVPWTASRSNQLILKNQPWIFIGRTDAEAETPILMTTWLEEPAHWKRPWC